MVVDPTVACVPLVYATAIWMGTATALKNKARQAGAGSRRLGRLRAHFDYGELLVL
jgi:hypothetical protein